MKIETNDNFDRKLHKLVKRDAKLKTLIDRKLELLLLDQKPSGLRIHKVDLKRGSAWSLSINLDLRIMFVYAQEDTIVLFDIGKHDEVY